MTPLRIIIALLILLPVLRLSAFVVVYGWELLKYELDIETQVPPQTETGTLLTQTQIKELFGERCRIFETCGRLLDITCLGPPVSGFYVDGLTGKVISNCTDDRGCVPDILGFCRELPDCPPKRYGWNCR